MSVEYIWYVHHFFHICLSGSLPSISYLPQRFYTHSDDRKNAASTDELCLLYLVKIQHGENNIAVLFILLQWRLNYHKEPFHTSRPTFPT